SLLQSSESTMPSPSSSSYSSSSSDNGFFDSLKNINATTWLLIILILAFLGFNIFAYLAKGTQTVTNIFGPLINKLFGTTVAITGQAVDISAEGAKAVVGGTAGIIESGLTAVQDVTPNGATAPSSVKGQPINQQQVDIAQQSTLNKALNTAQSQQHQQQDYQANEASSSVNSSGKSGWCYIGDDRGFRSCAQVGVNDTCMSGDIFPSQEICMNPNLRP
ncbi:hypothetical protein EB001_26080, partial [bacterium]|nr:hypothetical protein [bacterium]